MIKLRLTDSKWKQKWTIAVQSNSRQDGNSPIQTVCRCCCVVVFVYHRIDLMGINCITDHMLMWLEWLDVTPSALVVFWAVVTPVCGTVHLWSEHREHIAMHVNTACDRSPFYWNVETFSDAELHYELHLAYLDVSCLEQKQTHGIKCHLVTPSSYLHCACLY